MGERGGKMGGERGRRQRWKSEGKGTKERRMEKAEDGRKTQEKEGRRNLKIRSETGSRRTKRNPGPFHGMKETIPQQGI